MKPSQPKNFLLVDDHLVVTKGLAALLKLDFLQANFYTAANGKEALEELALHSIDILILDVSMPVMDGYEAIVIIRKNYPDLKIIILTQFEGEYLIRYFLLGNLGAVLLKKNTENLSHVVRQVWEIGYYASGDLIKKLEKILPTPEHKITLSPQNRILVKLISEGKSSKVIAEIMHLTENTVNSYRQLLLKQTGCKNTDELVAFAFKNALVAEST